MTFQPPERGAYEVLLREFDWENALPGEDPHWWAIADLRCNGRSLIEDFRLVYPGVPFTQRWSRTRADALEDAEHMIAFHRDHYFVAAA